MTFDDAPDTPWPELDPRDAIALLGTSSNVPSRFCVRWDRRSADDISQMLAEAVPPSVPFATSGTSGTTSHWWWDHSPLLDEAAFVAAAVPALGRPRRMLSFAPPRHLYGSLVSILVPALLRVPVWVSTLGRGQLPAAGTNVDWTIAAIPLSLGILARRIEWFETAHSVTILHSTAALAHGTATGLRSAAAPPMRLVEILGSTETGGIATRENSTSPDDPWVVAPHVRGRVAPDDGEVPLVVSSPMIARRDERLDRPEWIEMDDYVRWAGPARFVRTGRRSRLVKVNGRRFDLDALEQNAAEAFSSFDVACVPVTDETLGEHYDLLIAPLTTGASPTSAQLRAAASALPVAPRRLRAVDRIDRSETGKVRRLQSD